MCSRTGRRVAILGEETPLGEAQGEGGGARLGARRVGGRGGAVELNRQVVAVGADKREAGGGLAAALGGGGGEGLVPGRQLVQAGDALSDPTQAGVALLQDAAVALQGGVVGSVELRKGRVQVLTALGGRPADDLQVGGGEEDGAQLADEVAGAPGQAVDAEALATAS